MFIYILSFVLLYGVCSIAVLNTWTMSHSTHVFHLVDFSMGFCSRFLPGAIYNFLFDDLSVQAVSVYNFIIYIIFLILVAFLCAKLVNNSAKESKPAMLTTLLFFLTGPTIFSMLNFERGTLDHYWIYFASLSILFLSNKYFYALIVIFSLLSVMVNVGSMITYIPFIVLLMIYKTTVLTVKKEKTYLWCIISFTIISTFLLTLYFLVYERSNLVYSFEDFNSILKSRGYEQNISTYYSSILYSESYYDEATAETFDYLNANYTGFLARLFFRISVTFDSLEFLDVVHPLLLMTPVLVIIFSFISKTFKSTGNKIKKFTLLCMCGMFFLTLLGGAIFSSDSCRFLGHAYTLLFASVLYISQYEKDSVSVLCKTITKNIPACFLILYCICYSSVLLNPVG